MKNTQCTDTIVCPYCGYEYERHYSISQLNENFLHDDIEMECSNCGEEFIVYPNIIINFSSYKLDKPKDIEIPYKAEDCGTIIDLEYIEDLINISSIDGVKNAQFNAINESLPDIPLDIKVKDINSTEQVYNVKWIVEIGKYTEVDSMGERYWIDDKGNRYDYDPYIREEIEKHTVDGNIFDCTENIIVHQVNMYKKMGAGLAKQIRDRFPNVYEHYMKHDGKLGEVDIVPCRFKLRISDFAPRIPIKYIANLYSQDDYGCDGKRYTNYDAMRKGLNELAYHIKQSNKCGNNMTLAIPYGIGCGLGGGDWTIVSQIIVEELKDVEYKIYRLER